MTGKVLVTVLLFIACTVFLMDCAAASGFQWISKSLQFGEACSFRLSSISHPPSRHCFRPLQASPGEKEICQEQSSLNMAEN